MTRVAAETRVCVIGAGVMGASAAFHLAERGIATIVVERSVAGAEASGATAGTLALQNRPLPLIPFVQRAIDLWESLSDRLGMDVGYERRGGFRVAHTDDDIQRLEKAAATERALGLDVEMVCQPQLAADAPYLSTRIAAATFCARDGIANPFATLRAFITAARRRGASFWYATQVKGIQQTDDEQFLVETTRGTIRCSVVVAAAGAWNVDVARMVGISLPLTTASLQVITTDFGPALFPHVVYHVRANLTLKQQRTTGKIVIGGGWPGDGDPAVGVKRVRRDSLVGSLRWATNVVPGIANANVLRSWIGFESRTPDKALISGPVGPRGFHVLGCSYSGFTLSPLAGQIAAEYIELGQPTVPCRELSVQRFLAQPAEPPHP
jgi:sarcosine oxidase subunit beta